MTDNLVNKWMKENKCVFDAVSPNGKHKGGGCLVELPGGQTVLVTPTHVAFESLRMNKHRELVFKNKLGRTLSLSSDSFKPCDWTDLSYVPMPDEVGLPLAANVSGNETVVVPGSATHHSRTARQNNYFRVRTVVKDNLDISTGDKTVPLARATNLLIKAETEEDGIEEGMSGKPILQNGEVVGLCAYANHYTARDSEGGAVPANLIGRLVALLE